MKVTPIIPTQPLKNSPRQQRAVMAIRFEEHTVHDTKTGQSFELPAKEAWTLYEKLNKEGV